MTPVMGPFEIHSVYSTVRTNTSKLKTQKDVLAATRQVLP
jgi:hypothetical protein